MEKDLVIDVNSTEISIALLENHKLAELNKEQNNGSFSVGDVYIGKVKKVMPALNAAFVDIGDDKDAFIHYLDLGLNFRAFDYFVKQVNPNRDLRTFYSNVMIGPILEKEGKIADVLEPGQPIVVQIVKEPISTKGSRLTAEISIAGRNIVLLPFADKVNVSQKISSKEEKRRLERLVYSILPKNYGVIIRTAAEGKKAAVLDAELKMLIRKWEEGCAKIVNSKPPQLLFTENSRTTTILRDLLSDSFSNIHVNDEAVYREVADYISTIAPEQEKIVKLYSGGVPIFDHFDVTRQIKGSFGRVVPIKQGAYIVIEHTEALHVVDVNSGIRAKNGVDQEQNSFEVNLHAADEIARQLRLRDMGGIIIVDFIDMHEAAHRKELYNKLKEEMSKDRARHTILPASKFGLIQITRQRVRPETEVTVHEKCPTCNGSGKIQSSSLLIDEIENNMRYLLLDQNEDNITIQVHPFVCAYLTKGLFSIKGKWKRKYNRKITIKEVKSFHITQYNFLNKNGDEILL